jgi:pilus assembly protein Flp/PilA
MKRLTERFIRESDGVTAIEYGLIAGLITALIVGSVTTIGEKVAEYFSTIATALTT